MRQGLEAVWLKDGTAMADAPLRQKVRAVLTVGLMKVVETRVHECSHCCN